MERDRIVTAESRFDVLTRGWAKEWPGTRLNFKFHAPYRALFPLRSAECSDRTEDTDRSKSKEENSLTETTDRPDLKRAHLQSRGLSPRLSLRFESHAALFLLERDSVALNSRNQS